MKLTISCKHMKHSEALNDRIKQKTGKIEKYLDPSANVQWTCWQKDEHHHVEVNIMGIHGQYHATADHKNLYKCFDMAVTKLDKQLSKRKEKFKNKIHAKIERPVTLDPEAAWDDYDEDYFEDVAS